MGYYPDGSPIIKEIIKCWNIKCKKFDLKYANNCNDYFNSCTQDCKKFIPFNDDITIERVSKKEIVIKVNNKK